MSRVHTCFWFESDGLAAARLYTSLIPDSRIEGDFEGRDGRGGGFLNIPFTLGGTPYRILQAGPMGQHSEMASITVETVDEAETDRLWEALTADGGAEGQCGWLKDRWGLSWQIVPAEFSRLTASGEPGKVGAMMAEMQTMKKLDMARLRAAYEAG